MQFYTSAILIVSRSNNNVALVLAIKTARCWFGAELHLAVKTTTAATPARFNVDVVKPRKSPAHTKNKPVKYKQRPNKERRPADHDDEPPADRDDIDLTTALWHEPRTPAIDTLFPVASGPPWVVLQGAAPLARPWLPLALLGAIAANAAH